MSSRKARMRSHRHRFGWRSAWGKEARNLACLSAVRQTGRSAPPNCVKRERLPPLPSGFTTTRIKGG